MNRASTAQGRHPHRSREIAEVLARHGLGYLVGMFGLERVLPFHRGLLGHAPRSEPYTRPEHVRLALEELGATFVKLGQILSTRPDLMPPDYQTELTALQDQVSPVPYAQIQQALVAELGRPVEEAFATFDPAPLAAASIGQAHAATLADGTEVVVKVRRPGVVAQVEQDLEILQNLAATASRRWERAQEYDLVGLAQEFAQTLRAELDYLREGHNAERIAANFRDRPEIHVPRIYWDTTTSCVLTLERIRGTKINDLPGLEAAGIDRAALARRASDIVLKMVFEDAFFHADPHPGNFFVESDGRIGLIDYGMVGSVDDRTREQLGHLLAAITSEDADRLVDTFLELGVARKRIDRDLLRLELAHLLRSFYGVPLGEIALGPLLQQTLAIVRGHRLQLPSNLLLLLKTAIMSEGLAAALDPSFRLTGALAPYAQRLVLAEYAPAALGRKLAHAGIEAARAGIELPQQFRRLLLEAERGNLEVGVRPEGFEPLVRRLERVGNRIVLGLLAGSFIVGLATLMSVYHPPGWDQWVAGVFALGFVLAVALGVYLAIAILRSGRG